MEMKRTALASLAGIGVLLATAAGFAWMMEREWLEPDHMDLAAAAILILGAGAGALSCGKGEGSWKRLPVVQGILLGFLAMVNLGIFDGQLRGWFPVTVLVAGTAAGTMLAMNGRNRRKSYSSYSRRKRTGSKLNKKPGR